jgi:hypothetical protein
MVAKLVCYSWRKHLLRGPVAQLGARFHGMEEVVGSNPTRSTKLFPIDIPRIAQPSRSGEK